MPHKNFEHYADQRLMNGSISDIFIKIFEKNVAHTNPHLKILDYGCGDGKYFLFLCRYFEKNAIFGLEVSEKRIIRCKRIGWDNVFKIETFKQFPFDDNFFDVIIFDQVIEHISLKEIDFCLSELQRVLKKEGKMILITPNYPIKRV
jgi:ubiquinone/menaquinone biosynthesis C-methylase UbiE